MKETPIIFSGPMVRAILEGRKTQTRRLCKLTHSGHLQKGKKRWHPEDPKSSKGCRYAVGDRLWVREACFAQSSPDGEGVAYPADRSWRIIDHTKEATEKWLDLLYYRRRNDDGFEGSTGKLVPPIHMPRWASRITLAVTAVRVQRLQEISEEDAIAEGVCSFAESLDSVAWGNMSQLDRVAMVHATYGSAVAAYRHLWESIHGAESLERNPWVVAISFRRV